MPYTIRKQNCKQSDGDRGTYVLSYTDKKGKKHRNCHTSRKKAKGQIAAIEAESVEGNDTKIGLSELRQMIHELVLEEVKKKKPKRHDQDGDSDEDFADVMIARMKAGGLSDDDAYKKSRKFD